MIDGAAIMERITKRDRFPTVLVVGDVILDEYIVGEAKRISPEAPVPVVEIGQRTWRPGGAANVAANISALGGKVILHGVVGNDPEADRLRNTLAGFGISTSSLICDDQRATTCKMRVLAQNQQIVRLDRECREPLASFVEDLLIVQIDRSMHDADVCIVSDYGKGVVTPRVARHTIVRCKAAGVPVLVDPKSLDLHLSQDATLVKPNKHEAERLAQRQIRDDATFLAAGRYLSDLLPGTAVLITRGALGMALFRRHTEPFHLAPVSRTVYDVTGAGDTVISTLAIAMAAGANVEESAWLATHAAAIAVDKLGTATVSISELRRLCTENLI